MHIDVESGIFAQKFAAAITSKPELLAGALQVNNDLRDALGAGFTPERFLAGAACYMRPSRDFHGLEHLFAMARKSDDPVLKQYPGSADMSAVAGFYHDTEYPSIGEDFDVNVAPLIATYVAEVEGKKPKAYTIEPLGKNDKWGKALYALFGLEANNLLQPFGEPGGLNEFPSAVFALHELLEMQKINPQKVTDTFILGVLASIQATVPFKAADRMEKLRSRINALKADFSLENQDIDTIMVAATHTANRDISSFLGKLDPVKIGEAPTEESALHTMYWGDRLSTEEVPSLRIGGDELKEPGEYTPADFLEARTRRAGLYHVALKVENGAYTNMFYATPLSDDTTYPGQAWVNDANRLAYENNQAVALAQKTRLIAAAMVYALADKQGAAKTVQIKDFLKDTTANIHATLPEGADDITKRAFACLSDRQDSSYDINRSPIAQLLLSKMSEAEIDALSNQIFVAMRGNFFADPKIMPTPEAQRGNEFLKIIQGSEKASAALSTVQEILNTQRLGGYLHKPGPDGNGTSWANRVTPPDAAVSASTSGAQQNKGRES